MKALSIRQPWAWLITEGHKDIENRDWATSYRGRILIHSGKTMRMRDYRAAAEFAANLGVIIPHAQELLRGGVVGVATMTDCVRHSRSPWFFGKHGFVLSEPMPLPFAPCAGQLGFFDVEREISQQLRQWWISQTTVSQEAL